MVVGVWWVCRVVRAAEGEMQPGADRACPVCFCQCAAAAASLKSRQDRRGGKKEKHWQRGPGVARWVCGEGKAQAEPGSLGA